MKGLRERKKQATREAIAAAAMELFQEHGFDNVTVGDVARAADVSEKTVFNYFPAKEDLVFALRWQRQEELVDRIRNRPASASIVQPFRDWTNGLLDRVELEPVEEIVAVPRLVMGSKALRDRLFIGWEQEAAALAPVIAAEAGAPEGDLVAAIVTRSLTWTHRLIFRQAFARLLDGEPRKRVARELRADAERAYDVLERGLGAYGSRPR
jgi:AcrR family transcriptional regulator